MAGSFSVDVISIVKRTDCSIYTLTGSITMGIPSRQNILCRANAW